MSKSDIYQAKVSQSPENVMFRFSLGQALYEEGRSADAVTHLEKCVASRDDWMLPRILLGKVLLQQKQEDAARPHLEDALTLAIAQHHDAPAAELRLILKDL